MSETHGHNGRQTAIPAGPEGANPGAPVAADLPDRLPVIGWQERVDFPRWGVDGVLAKIDTGACISAIHAVNIEPVGDDRVSFSIALDRGLRALSEPIVWPIRRESRVRSSNGQLQQRFVVCAAMDVGGHVKEIELSLVCRKSMRCRMLLGRDALSGSFVIDPSRDYLLTHRPAPIQRTTKTRPRKKKKTPNQEERR